MCSIITEINMFISLNMFSLSIRPTRSNQLPIKITLCFAFSREPEIMFKTFNNVNSAKTLFNDLFSTTHNDIANSMFDFVDAQTANFFHILPKAEKLQICILSKHKRHHENSVQCIHVEVPREVKYANKCKTAASAKKLKRLKINCL